MVMTKKDDIMDATYRLIVENGLYNVSTGDIKQAAETSPGTIFYYFKSKDELIEEVLKKYLLDMYRSQLDVIASFSGSTYDCLKMFCHKILELESSDKKHQDEVKNGLLCFFEGKKQYPNLSASFDDYDEYFISILADIVDKGKSVGEIREDLDTGELVVFIKFHLYGIFFLWMVDNISDVEEYVELTFTHMWNYMKV